MEHLMIIVKTISLSPLLSCQGNITNENIQGLLTDTFVHLLYLLTLIHKLIPFT